MADLARLEAQRSTHLRQRLRIRERLVNLILRRFRRGLITTLLTIAFIFAGLVVIAALLLFRPSSLNDLLDSQLPGLFTRGKDGFSFDRTRTLITLPSLNGEGSASLFDVTIKSRDGSYDLLYIPRIDLSYDLLGLPRRPLTRVSLPEGAWAVAHFNAEGWANENVFAAQPEEEEASEIPIDLPELDIKGLVLRFRVPDVMRDAPQETAAREFLGHVFPASLGASDYLSNIDLSLKPSRTLSDGLDLRFSTDCDRWGKMDAFGSIGRNLNDPQIDLHFHRHQVVNDAFANRFRDEVLWTYDLLHASGPNNSLDARAHFQLSDGKPVISAEALYRGSVMFAKVPLAAHDATALVHFDGTNLKIVDAVGRRGGAIARVTGAVNNVGRDTESVSIDINLSGIALDDDTMAALNGELDENGLRHWPEFEHFKRANSSIRPVGRLEKVEMDASGYTGFPKLVVVPDAFGVVGGYFEPGGMANVNVKVESRPRIGDNIEVTAMLVDATMRAVGDVRALADYAATMPSGFGVDEAPGLRALGILGKERSVTRETASEEPITSFPMQLYNVRGVIRAEIPPSDRSIISVRGFNEAEALIASQQLGGLEIPATKGLIAHRRESKEFIQIEGMLSDDNPATPVDDSELQLDVSSSELLFDKNLEDLLPSNVRRALSSYNLRENFQIDRAIVRVAPLSGGETIIDLRISPKNMTAKIRLGDAKEELNIRRVRSGQVSYRSETSVVQVTGLAASVSAPLDGIRADNLGMTLDLNQDKLNLKGRLNNVPLSESLFDVLPSQLASVKSNFIDPATGAFMLEGSANIDLDIELDLAGDASRFRLTIQIDESKDCQLGFARFAPMLIGGIKGSLIVDVGPAGTTISIPKITGKPLLSPTARKLDEISSVAISGALYQAPRQSMRWQFAIKGSNLDLNDTLRRSLVTMLGEPRGPQIADIWKSLEPAGSTIGRIDVDGTVSGSDDTEPQYLVRVDMNGGRVQHESFRLPLEDLQASITIAPGDVRIDKLQASIKNRGSISFPNVSLDAEGRFAVTLSARDFELDEAFGKALPAALRGAYQQLSPEGKMDADVTVLIGSDTIEYETRLKLKGMALSLGLRFTDLDGVIVTHVVVPDSKDIGDRLVSGEAQLTKAKWKNLELLDTQSSIQLVENRLVLPNIRGRIAGGFLRGKLDLNLEDDAKFWGSFVARGMQLESIASALGNATKVDESATVKVAADPDANSEAAEDTAIQAILKGGVDAELTFSNSPNAEGQIGTGRIDIGPSPIDAKTLEDHEENIANGIKGEDAVIGNVPLFNGLYSALQLGKGEHFNEAHLLFWLMEERVQIRQLALISDSLRVENSGPNRILYEGKPNAEQLQLTLVPTFFPRTPEIPVLQPVLDAIKGLVFRVYIHGSLDSPQVEALTRKRELEAKASRQRKLKERPANLSEEEEEELYPDHVRPDYSRPGS